MSRQHFSWKSQGSPRGEALPSPNSSTTASSTCSPARPTARTHPPRGNKRSCQGCAHLSMHVRTMPMTVISEGNNLVNYALHQGPDGQRSKPSVRLCSVCFCMNNSQQTACSRARALNISAAHHPFQRAAAR